MKLNSGDYPWCIVVSDGNKVCFVCERCQERHVFDNTGMSIDRFVEIAGAFCLIHRDCKEKDLASN